MGLVTPTFDLETGMRVASKVGTFLSNLGTLGLWVLELFAMYATDGQTDKSNTYCLLSYGPRHNNYTVCQLLVPTTVYLLYIIIIIITIML